MIYFRSEIDDFDVDSADEDDHDFTDADAAIDRMLDELQDFQIVCYFVSLFTPMRGYFLIYAFANLWITPPPFYRCAEPTLNLYISPK